MAFGRKPGPLGACANPVQHLISKPYLLPRTPRILGLLVSGLTAHYVTRATPAPRPRPPFDDSRLIYEPEPVSGWTSELQMKDFSLEKLITSAPVIDDVRQGHTGNCPLIATLAALAHAHPNKVQRMVARRNAEVSARVIDTNQTAHEYHELHYWSPFLFEVVFAAGIPIFVSGYLWHRGGVLEYGRSERGDLWPSILEKAFVVEHGGNSYGKIFGSLIPFEVMNTVLGPSREVIARGASEAALEEILKKASKKPTIADTFTNLPPRVRVPNGIIGFHTYAVRGMKGQTVQVYNPLDGQTIDISLATFQRVFETVVQAN